MGFCMMCGGKLTFIRSEFGPGGRQVTKMYQCMDKSCEIKLQATYDPRLLIRGSTLTIQVS